MNYFTGQSLAYLLALTVILVLFSVLLLFMVGGSFVDSENSTIHVESITEVVGKTQTRNGGE